MLASRPRQETCVPKLNPENVNGDEENVTDEPNVAAALNVCAASQVLGLLLLIRAITAPAVGLIVKVPSALDTLLTPTPKELDGVGLARVGDPVALPQIVLGEKVPLHCA